MPESTQVPKQPIRVVDKHPQKAKTIQYSHCFCEHCNQIAYMAWIVYGVTKKCPNCKKENNGWKKKNDITL